MSRNECPSFSGELGHNAMRGPHELGLSGDSGQSLVRVHCAASATSMSRNKICSTLRVEVL